MKGIEKRCGCRDEQGRKIGARCPLLKRSGHGSYGYRIDLGPGLDGKGVLRQRRQEYRGGFARRKDAEQAKAEHVTRLGQGQQQARTGTTCGQWWQQWLEGKVNLRPSTRRSYETHIRLYLQPHLGHVRLQDLTTGHVERMYASIRSRGGGRTVGPATVRRVHATVMSALNTAVRRRLLAFNPAQHVEMESAHRPEVHPWEPVELGAFLDAASADRLGAIYHLMAMTGLRRGEAVGLRWADVDLERGIVAVRQTITDVGGRLVVGRPKTSGSERRVDLDGDTIGTLLEHRLRQDLERGQWGDAWTDSGLVFTREDGSGLRPEYVTRHMQALAEAAGLPRKRLHDLRHGSASLQLAAGVSLSIVSKRLGHSSVTITSDTYSHMLEGVGRQAAEAAAALVPRALRGHPQDHEDPVSTPDLADDAGLSPQRKKAQIRRGAPPGTRTPNPRIKSPLLCQLS